MTCNTNFQSSTGDSLFSSTSTTSTTTSSSTTTTTASFGARQRQRQQQLNMETDENNNGDDGNEPMKWTTWFAIAVCLLMIPLIVVGIVCIARKRRSKIEVALE